MPISNLARLATLLLAALAIEGRAQPTAPSDSAPRANAPGGPGSHAACAPVETRTPNAEGQQPAFAGQTRACAAPTSTGYEVTVIAKGSTYPWALEPLPGGDFLVTEKRRAPAHRLGRRPSRASRSPACRRSMRAARAGCSTSR